MLDPSPAELWTTWRDAARLAAVDVAIRDLYNDIDQTVRDAPRDGPHVPPTCNASGRCCKFDTYGHRLYVTGLEIAWFMDRVSGHDTRVPGLGCGVSEAPRGVPGEPSGLALPVIDPGDERPTGADSTRDPRPGTRVEDACRYQIDGLCSAHPIRPLGCRVYFCTPGTEDWQRAVYERFQSRLQQLHTDHALPYRYMEWRAGLIEADRYLSSSDRSSAG